MNSVIEKYLPEETGFQKTIFEAMNYSVQAGGKRLRPILMAETFKLFGGEGEVIKPFMAGIEMIHTYSLVHDDLPAMDNDEYRRGKKTTHAKFGEAMGILAGDALLNYAYETVSEAFTVEPQNPRIGKAFAVFAKKAGVFGMVGGQVVDVESEKKPEVEITREKLDVLKKHNVTRISVNPQTMKQKTLDIIGRRHTVEQVREAFLMAREAGFDNINMDFIVGLPEETIDDIRMTMEETKLLKPDSITIHSLAVKRAARLNIFKEEYDRYAYNNSEEIMTLTYNSAAEMGMEPYYLYRQKNMTGNMENVGYSVPGKAGIYNILIMEEKHPIIALGAGASTKIVYPGEEKIERVENVKDVKEYISRVDEMIERKRKAVCEWKKSLKTS